MYQLGEITSLASSNPPEGHSRRTVRLLAWKVVELGFTESISRETIRLLLKKRAHALKGTLACLQGMYFQVLDDRILREGTMEPEIDG